jgi:hypothetical protein
MNERRVIRGHDGPLEIDELKRTVTKTFPHVELETAARKVQREVAYASCLFAALSRTDGVACPKILSWSLSPPRVVMRLCPGEPLSRYLRRREGQDARVPEIARKIHDGLEVYTRLFDEPYYDLSFPNILYDRMTGIVTFLDFGVPDRNHETNTAFPLEASLGNLVGWACYEMVRPESLFAARRRYLATLRAVLETFRGRISGRQVRVLAYRNFLRLTRSGTTVRRGYYGTVGTVGFSWYCYRLGLGFASSGSAAAADTPARPGRTSQRAGS